MTRGYRSLLVAIAALVLLAQGAWAQTPGWSSFLTKAVFEGYFPNRVPFYTYEAFQTAAEAYPAFGTSGTLDDQKRELAAFLGNVNQESGGNTILCHGHEWSHSDCRVAFLDSRLIELGSRVRRCHRRG